jgi:HEAT repeat protein
VSRAALLSLVAIGDKSGLETVAYTLLNGENWLRKAAAEALANNMEEGHPALQEASTLEDANIRRAAVFGLGRLRLPWSIEILNKLATQDQQWIVQDAANQFLISIQKPHPRTPHPLPSPPQTAWLVAFAGERGMGVAPGKPAYDLLHKALQEGNEDQQLAALYYLGMTGNEKAVLPIYQVYHSSKGDVHEAAYNALWNLNACGIPLPLPAYHGLS